jgi:uncharacterized protein
MNDFGDYLNLFQIQSLNSRCVRVAYNTSYEIALVTVRNTSGQDRLDYASRIGEQNGVGKADTDNGIVVLWSQGDDKGIAIAVGRGAESVFNDAKVSRYARDARPLFNEGKYYEGFNKILDDIESELNGTTTNTTTKTTTEMDDFTTTIIIVVIILMVIIFISKLVSYLAGNGDNDDDDDGTVLGIIPAVISGGRGSGSGGGFSFGGGSFGGGGGRG